ncbi:MAG: phage tail protein [Cyanophyceae cyanobacterium]|jgi:phage tail-like protein
MADQIPEGLTNSRFYFEADEIEKKYIKSISALKVSSTPAGGAENKVIGVTKSAQFVRQATPTFVTFSPVTIEIVATGNSDLYDWYARCNSNVGSFNPWQGFRMNASITVYDQAGEPRARWELQKTYPHQYEVSGFDSEGTGWLTEKIVLVHEGIARVPVENAVLRAAIA